VVRALTQKGDGMGNGLLEHLEGRAAARRGGRLALGLALLAALLCATATAASAGASGNPRKADSVTGIPGLPTGVPAAAIAPEAALPEPERAEWPFPSNFSHTSGTGLLSDGASLWTDFVYDDHGPLGSPVGIAAAEQVSDLAPVHGGFTYPSGPADGDGADIFTAAVGYTKKATYWRVDWNTLADADVPIAEWALSTGSSSPASTETWPANAGLRSSDVQYALVVSAQHAQLLEAATGKVVPGGELQTQVNMQARSFVVRIPTSVLAVSGSWQVRLAAGLANGAGTEFATVGPEDGGIPGGTNVYNVTFRTYQQEAELVCPTEALPDSEVASKLEGELGAASGESTDHVPVAECGNMWMENDQANTLATGNVTKYSLSVDWAQLAERKKTPEPEPTGYSNRWYVSPLKLGEGVVDAQSPDTYTGPTYLGRVQPYAVYVPSTYNPATPTPLTWILHSLGANLNQYGGVAPSQLEEECQERDSICATTEGFSDGQWYYEDAQVDFWDVWHQLAEDYDLNPDQTVMSGYSMGGFASYKLTLEYPDLFAQAMPLEGPVICGTRVTPPFEEPAGAGQCTSAGNTTPLVVNAKWVPYVMTYGAIDELVPFTGGVEQVEDFNKLGYRYYAVLYPTEDHLVFSVQNDFAPADSQLGHLEREKDPGSFTFTWYPELVSSTLGIGPTGDYWLTGLRAREAASGQTATVKASSGAIAEPAETLEHHTGAADGPTPAVTDSQTWTAGAAPPSSQTLKLELTNVAAAAVKTAAAKLACATATVSSDGASELQLLELRPGSSVTLDGSPATSASSAGVATVQLADGTSTLQFCGHR
jgi:predicted esterase